MAQELLIIDGKIDVSSLNKNIENQYIAMGIKVATKKKSDGKGTFKSVKAYMVLDCYDIDGNYEGENVRWLDVHFTKDAFEDSMSPNIKSIESLSTGTLYVLASKLQAPTVYRLSYKTDENGVEELDKDGERIVKYPVIWLKGGICGFIPYVPEQDKFNRKPKKHEDAKDVDFEEEAKDLTTE